MPDGWWLCHPSCTVLLAVLVHKGNPDVASDPTTVVSGATRNSLREQQAEDTLKRRMQAKEIEMANSKRGKIDEKQQEAKTALMEQALSMGKVEEVKEQLHLLKEFKESITNVEENGEDASEFDKAANELIGQLPFMQQRRLNSKNNSGD